MPKKNLSKKSKAAHILLEIADAMDPLLTFGYCPTLVLRYGMDGVREIRAARERAARRRELQRLKERKLIRIKKVANQYHVKLTEEGQKQIFRLKIMDTDFLEDGRVTMVAFDIPEVQKRLRKQLRHFLNDACFIPIQRSVWISQYDSAKLLAEFFGMIHGKRWVRVFYAEETTLRK